MKVLMSDGSPHEKGCTYAILAEVAGELNQAGVETEIMRMGGGIVHGCMGCGACGKPRKYIYSDGKVNEAVRKMRQGDRLVVGSPVHYASTNGAVTSFLDRFFYSGSNAAAHKPGAVVASVRRAGTATTLDQLNECFVTTQVPVVSSQYWDMVRGQYPEDVKGDEEGVQIIHVLNRSIAWMLKSIRAGKTAEVALPETEEKKRTSFIR